MPIERHLEDLQKKSAKAHAELAHIERLRQQFPDLEIDKDRWGHVRYMAKSANARVDQVLFHRNCGCCADSPLHARPYLEFEGQEVYSNPCNVMVGRPDWLGYGFIENDYWRKTYEEAGVNPKVIERIQTYLEPLSHDEEEGDE